MQDCAWRARPAYQPDRQDSYPVLFFPLEGRVESLEKSFHLGQGTDRDELNSITIAADLQFFPGAKAHALSDTSRYNNLKLVRECYRIHVDLPFVIRISDRYGGVKGFPGGALGTEAGGLPRFARNFLE